MMAVWGHNSSHRFSQFPPQIFICAPEEMTRVRRRDLYNYPYIRPYYSIKYMGECVPLVFGNDER